MILRVHAILPDTRAEGPGNRFCVWVQGCDRRCPGCAAPYTWDMEGGQPMAVDHLLRQLEERVAQEPPLEGVTFLGGEPFLQAGPLARVAQRAHELGLSVFCFSGRTIEELRASNDPEVAELLAQVDVLADGPYVQELRSFDRPWVGSSNQRFHFLTQRYDPQSFLARGNVVEVRIRPDGTMQVNGMARF